MTSLRQTIRDAINQSKRQNEIVTLRNHDLVISSDERRELVTLWNPDLGPPIDDPAEVARVILTEYCDDYVEHRSEECTVHEFWGRTLSGADWRVHVRVQR